MLMAGQAMTILVDCLGYFCISATLPIGNLRQTSFVLFSSFAIFGDAIIADLENHAPKPQRESRAAQHSLG